MSKKYNINIFINFILLVLSISSAIIFSFIVYYTYIYKLPLNDKVPFKYESSNKTIDYLIILNPTGLYYDSDYRGLYIYNELYDVYINYILEGFTLEQIKDLYFYDIEDIIYTQVTDNVYNIAKVELCDEMLLSIKYNNKGIYTSDVAGSVETFDFCYQGY